MPEKSALEWFASVLLAIAGLNWGLVGINSFSGIAYDYDLVAFVFGSAPWLAALIYLLFGLAAIFSLIKLLK